MSRRAETDSHGRTGTPRPGGYGHDGPGDRAAHLDVIACDGCGRSFATPDGPADDPYVTGQPATAVRSLTGRGTPANAGRSSWPGR